MFPIQNPPAGQLPCPPSPCEAKQQGNDNLASAAVKAIKNQLNAYSDVIEFGGQQPFRLAKKPTPCNLRATDLKETAIVERFNRYREAMPYANAALDLNLLKDAAGGMPNNTSPRERKNYLKKKSGLLEKCLTRLPDTAEALNKELGLPAGTLKDGHLRNDTTGYRAAIYRSEVDGSLIMVPRDTQPDSLVDWKTNTDNGQGRDTDQYKSTRDLARLLTKNKVPFNIAGYSKGGGMAQEAGLIAKNAKVKVFNAAGLHEASLKRTGNKGFDKLAERTQAFSAEGDFLTFMNNTTDPQQQLINTRFLRDELAGDGSGINPMKIKVSNPQMRAAIEEDSDADTEFAADRESYLADIDNMIGQAQQQINEGLPVRIFPSVKAGHQETLPNSIPLSNWDRKVKNANPNLAKMIQHRMQNVTMGLTDTLKQDKKALQEFLKKCG
ncbi:MAG: DUF2974 domain-containing protein [Oceanospirillaceae bacterium]|nr:DUF2974 domain-containing protein [Oceanospirillaceae bacterium]